MARFFTLTSVVLVLVAAGLVMTAFHTAHEAGWVNFGQAQAADLTWLVRPGTPLASLLTGVLGIQPTPAVIEVARGRSTSSRCWSSCCGPTPQTAGQAGRPGAALGPRAGPARGALAQLTQRCARPRPTSPDPIPHAVAVRGSAAPCPKGTPAMSHRRLLTAIAVATAVPLVAAGCAASSGGSRPVRVERAGRAPRSRSASPTTAARPSPASIGAGALKFAVANKGANRVTEAEVLQDGRILGEKENLTPGLSGSFSLRLEAGQYVVYCPNAKTDRATLTVTPAAGATGDGDGRRVADARRSRRTARSSRTRPTQLVPATRAFVAAVKAGDIAKAKALYAPARSHYESIEPVAESFGDLDPEIDARVNDVASPSQWTGFHRIEKALWQDKSLKGMDPYADQLMADVTKLQKLIPTAKLQPAAIANGAVDLLGEVANSKITGEEDRYSHTDLWDFEANVAGVREALDVLTPALKQRNPTLLATANSQFDAVGQALSTYKTADGYVNYATVGTADRRRLTTLVNTLAETMSKVAPAIV